MYGRSQRRKKVSRPSRGGRLRARKSGIKSYRKIKSKVSRSSRPSTAIIRQPSGLPDRTLVKLVYEGYIDTAQAGGALADHRFAGNSIIDCDITTGVGQPYLTTEWAQFYTRYTVTGSSIEVNAMTNALAVYNTQFFVTPSLDAVDFKAEPFAAQQPYTKRNQMLVTTSGGASIHPTKHYMSTAKIYGKPKAAVTSEDDYSALFSAQPANLWYWHVSNWVPGNNAQSFIGTAKITYYVQLFDRALPST